MKYAKCFFMLLLAFFSFYLSDRLLIYVESLSPIMKTINDTKTEYEEQAVNAIIENNTIIPGKKGKIVNERESYLNMKSFKEFNDNFFVYDYVKPDVSLEDNLDKIIIKGSKKNKISIISDNSKINSYLIENNEFFDVIVYNREEITNIKNIEYIDGNGNLKLNLKNKICLIGFSNISLCKNKKNYLISPPYILDNNNLYNISKIDTGSIVFIDKTMDINNFKVLYNKIKSNNLDIIKISDLIRE